MGQPTGTDHAPRFHNLTLHLVALAATLGLVAPAQAGCTRSVGIDESLTTCIGTLSLNANTTGDNNIAIGYGALYCNTMGNSNTVSGVSALRTNTTGGMNVAVGFEAARAQTTGSSNTVVGYRAGLKWTTGMFCS